MVRVRARQADTGKTKVPPVRFLVSRTAAIPGTSATSTHPPLEPLWLDLCHCWVAVFMWFAPTVAMRIRER